MERVHQTTNQFKNSCQPSFLVCYSVRQFVDNAKTWFCCHIQQVCSSFFHIFCHSESPHPTHLSYVHESDVFFLCKVYIAPPQVRPSHPTLHIYSIKLCISYPVIAGVSLDVDTKRGREEQLRMVALRAWKSMVSYNWVYNESAEEGRLLPYPSKSLLLKVNGWLNSEYPTQLQCNTFEGNRLQSRD